MSKTIGVVLKPGVTETLPTLRMVRSCAPGARFLIEEAGHHTLTPGAAAAWRDIGLQARDIEQFERESDLVLVLGGDGTLIHAASLMPNRLVPILGVNMGHIGFLTEVTRDEVLDVLPHALGHTLPFSDRMRLDVAVRHAGTVQLQKRILNDAVIAMRSLARIATFRVSANGALVTTIRGDGVIFSTPTGSTAYALAAGGPIISPQMEAIAVTPIAPHQLTQRPLILPADAEVTVSLDTDSTVFASLDGHTGVEMVRGDDMVVARAPVPTRLLTVPWQGYYQTLRTKLRWGDG